MCAHVDTARQKLITSKFDLKYHVLCFWYCSSLFSTSAVMQLLRMCLQSVVAASSALGACVAPETPMIALLDLLLEFCEHNLHRVTASGVGFPLNEFLFELGKLTLLRVS